VKKNLALPLIGLGSLLLVAAIVCVTWAPGVAKRTPLDVDSTTLVSGTAKKLNTSTGELETFPVRAVSVTKVDAEVSDDDNVVFQNHSCLMVDDGDLPPPPACLAAEDPRTVSFGDFDFFVTDRHTAEAVSSEGYLPGEPGKQEGLVNKWPFDSKKKDYLYWESTIEQAVPATYERTEKLEGLEVYVYRVEVTDAQIEVAEGVPGTYTDVKEIYVDPPTGSVVQQTEDQQRWLADGTQALDLQIAFTDEQVKTSVEDAKSNHTTLNLITLWVPLIGFVGGALCLAAGVFLLVTTRGAGGSRRADGGDDLDADDGDGAVDDQDSDDKLSLDKS